jgi:hypothetical protein
MGFGYVLDGLSGGGQWRDDEKDFHINCKELLAVLYGLQALCSEMRDCHTRVMSDNQTTVAYIREIGGSVSIRANEIARNIWLWASHRNVWLSAAHVPGVENVLADTRSREFRNEAEWMLNKKDFLNFFPDLKKIRWTFLQVDLITNFPSLYLGVPNQIP